MTDFEQTATVECICGKEHTLKVYNNNTEWVLLDYHVRKLQLEKMESMSAALVKVADAILRSVAYR